MAKAEAVASVFELETAAIADLRPHPRNYRAHPADQLDHLGQSLREHGQYRNIAVARDGTILAGHGVVEAATRIGWETVRVVRLDIDPDSVEAIKILTGDNEVGSLAVINDRLLTDHLTFIASQDALLGTGYDSKTLAALVYVTRPGHEIGTMDEAAEWAGLPGDYAAEGSRALLVVSFDDEVDRDALVEQLALVIAKKTRGTWSAWWPPRERNDLSSLQFDG